MFFLVILLRLSEVSLASATLLMIISQNLRRFVFQQRGNVSGEIWCQFKRVKVLSLSRDILKYKSSDEVPKIYRFTAPSIISMALNRAQRIFLVTKNYFNEKFNAPPTFPVYTEETARLFGDSECYQRLGCSMVGNIQFLAFELITRSNSNTSNTRCINSKVLRGRLKKVIGSKLLLFVFESQIIHNRWLLRTQNHQPRPAD